MNIRFVEAFYWVATLKSVTRAADKLFLTQSAMSSRISALEQELGVLLIDRRYKQFRLTTAGVRFMTYAQRMLELQREIRSVMGSGVADEPLVIRVGAIESVLHSWLIPWLEKLRKTYPTLSLELSVETTPVLTEQVSRGTLDVVFAALPASGDGIRVEPMDSMAMVFFGHREIHKKRRYGGPDFSHMDVMTFQRGSQPHVALMDVFREAGVQPRMVHPMSSISAMVQLVQGGFGVATLPKRATRRISGFPDMKVLPSDLQLKPLPVHVSYRSDPANHLIETIVQSAIEYAHAVHKSGA